jgi:hypothetical protein
VPRCDIPEPGLEPLRGDGFRTGLVALVVDLADMGAGTGIIDGLAALFSGTLGNVDAEDAVSCIADPPGTGIAKDLGFSGMEIEEGAAEAGGVCAIVLGATWGDSELILDISAACVSPNALVFERSSIAPAFALRLTWPGFQLSKDAWRAARSSPDFS